MAANKATTTTSARAALPGWYRLVLTTVEPLSTLLGSLHVLRSTAGQAQYLAMFTRGAVVHQAGDTAFLHTQLAGAWLSMAFHGAVTLRAAAADDLRVWRLYCAAMLLSDALFAHSTAQAVGGWAIWLRAWEWGAGDWVLFWGSWPFAAVRVLVLLGFGVRA
ncbi:hypothetical protein P8C59_000432 [Phyllachora maydis]|uniref:DUF7704 domain-containing protein n=1 Tax=Phyllachora maydis TaxID=1825666 RepID=A0AAD9MAC4_9PEZI|nr:hypothetical protein P8C59_000432 [Phyllachora maydis]